MSLTLPQFIFWLSVAIGVPSMVVYVIEVIVILRDKNFDSAFYRLFVIRFIPNLINFVGSFFACRLGSAGWWQAGISAMPERFLAAVYIAGYYSLIAEQIATILMSLKRLTCIRWPMIQNQIWDWLLAPGTVLTFLAPLLVIGRLYFNRFRINSMPALVDTVRAVGVYSDVENFYVIGQSAPMSYGHSQTVGLISGVLGAVGLALNIATISYHAGHRRSYSVPDRKMEARLTAYSIAILLTHFLNAATFMLLSKASGGHPVLFFTIYIHIGIISDLCTVCAPSWLLYLASGEVRRAVRRQIAGWMCWRRWLDGNKVGSVAARSTGNPASVHFNPKTTIINERTYRINVK